MVTEQFKDELRLTVAGQRLTGWQHIRVTRGVERMPSDFDIQVTEKYPGEPSSVVVFPGDVCKIEVGGDLLLTGYIDRYLPSVNGEDHTIRIMGRSKCQDLVDCSVIWKNNQLSSTSVRNAAELLAKDYGVTVRALDGDGPSIMQINVQLGETPFELIERLARWGAMLVYDDPTGNLVLAQVGKDSMSSGVREGVNLQQAQVTLTLDERFTEYHAYTFSTNSLSDVGMINGNERAVIKDPGMAGLKRVDGQPRVRVKAIISDQPLNGEYFAVVRARWEMARRYGRSQAIQVTVDSWRDSKGRLWEPNTRCPVHVPSCKVQNNTLIISEVSYMRSERGTEAHLTLMPPDAFAPEPTIIAPFYADVAQALHEGAHPTDGRRDRGSTIPTPPLPPPALTAPADGRRDR